LFSFLSNQGDEIIMKLLKPLFILFVILLWTLSIPYAFAVEVSDEPQEYVVAISLKTVGEINKYVGSYDLDFWYSIYSEGKDLTLDPPPEVDFLNGKDIQFSSQYLGTDIFKERVQGTFFGEMDFHDFPFEKVSLRVELEPVTPFNTDYVVFSVDPNSGVDATANIPGWFISEPTFHVTENTYVVGESETSTAKASGIDSVHNKITNKIKRGLSNFIIISSPWLDKKENNS